MDKLSESRLHFSGALRIFVVKAQFDRPAHSVAKMPEGSTKEDAPRMLQSLLEERFKLTTHRAAAEHPVWALVVAKGGPKPLGPVSRSCRSRNRLRCGSLIDVELMLFLHFNLPPSPLFA